MFAVLGLILVGRSEPVSRMWCFLSAVRQWWTSVAVAW
jgi:hypothetical protein